MSHARSRSRIAALAIGATLAVPFFISSLQAGQRSLPVDPAQAPPPEAIANALFGYGKGWLDIPVVCQDGRMFGVLSDVDGRERFQLEALLTGCMPDAALRWPNAYWFGGLYGRIGKLRELNPDLQSEFGIYTVEGTWILDEPTFGSFTAIIIHEIASGRRFVVGKLYGEFTVAASSDQGATLIWDDASRPGKAGKSPFDEAGAYPADKLGDARTAPRKGDGKSAYDDAWRKVASDPWGDVVSVPRKGEGKTPFDEAGAYPGDKLGDARTAPRKGDGKSAYDDAWRKVASDPWGDVVSVPRKGEGKTPFGDAGSQPPKHLAGTFMLRFVILQ